MLDSAVVNLAGRNVFFVRSVGGELWFFTIPKPAIEEFPDDWIIRISQHERTEIAPIPRGDTGLEGFWTKAPPQNPEPIGWVRRTHIFEDEGFAFGDVGMAIPYWSLQLLFAVLPLWWLWRVTERWTERRQAKT